MSEIKRRKNESFESYIRRVKQTWQSSGRILEARKGQYFKGKPTKNARRKSALAKKETKGRMEYLRNAGKLSAKELAAYRRINK